MEDVGHILYDTKQFESLRHFGLCVVPSPHKEELLESLRMIHDAGVIHRDLRPDTISFDSAGNFRIFDFNRSHLDPPPEKMQAEVKILQEITLGCFFYQGLSRSQPPSSSEDTENYSDVPTAQSE